ncbi:MAG TPA: hypothetical protein VMM92_03445 [Thermoanaerobaculia bacterium]|nr:hypothetical protein [Thermoanaerobaculia bacterium]
MSDLPPYATAARRAAERLAALDPQLPDATERSLLAPSQGSAPARWATRGVDPGLTVGLAALLVSSVQLGWQLYRDLKKDRDARGDNHPAQERELRELLLEHLRRQASSVPPVPPAERDRVLTVVAQEIAGEPAGPDRG